MGRGGLLAASQYTAAMQGSTLDRQGDLAGNVFLPEFRSLSNKVSGSCYQVHPHVDMTLRSVGQYPKTGWRQSTITLRMKMQREGVEETCLRAIEGDDGHGLGPLPRR